MNLKELDNTWKENCPEEASGLVSKRTTPKRWVMKLQAYKNKKKRATKTQGETSYSTITASSTSRRGL